MNKSFFYEGKIFSLPFACVQNYYETNTNTKRTLDKSYVSIESTKFLLKVQYPLRTRLRIKHEYGPCYRSRARKQFYLFSKLCCENYPRRNPRCLVKDAKIVICI